VCVCVFGGKRLLKYGCRAGFMGIDVQKLVGYLQDEAVVHLSI
jgi:hypothetical protein